MEFERIRDMWQNLRLSLGFLPTILGLSALLLGLLVPEIDSRLSDELSGHRAWFFSGSASAARTILSAMAGSLVTVITLLFSITILMLQQASTQFTSRIIRNFTNDRGNQVVLGTFLGTFIYALLVLRQIRSDGTEDGAFVPVLSIALAFLLTLACMGLLVYFIHHSSTMFQATTVVERVHQDLLEQLDQRYPATVGEPRRDEEQEFQEFRRQHPEDESVYITADSVGYLRSIDTGTITQGLPDGTWAVVHPRIGHYVLHGQALLEVGGLPADFDGSIGHLRQAFVFGTARNLPQDELFGIRQLVDIALKSLSPSINDPTTAEHAISCLADALIVLAGRPVPVAERVAPADSGQDGRKQVVLWLSHPRYEDFVHAAFGQIRRLSRSQYHVMLYLVDVIGEVGRQVSGTRIDALRHQIDEIVWQAEQASLSPSEQAEILDHARASKSLMARGQLPVPETG